jgi:Ca-activated chloride channel family protein
MAVPLLGPMTLSGFGHAWYFLFLLVVLGLIGLYIIVQLARKKRLLRFANMELLESVAPKRPTRWRHLPTILLVLSLLLLTVAMAGPTHDVRIPRNRAVVMLAIDVSQSMRATDVPPNRLAAAQDAAKQFADELTPGINLGLIAYAGTATVLVSPTTNREAIKRGRQAAAGRPHRHRRGHLHRAAGHRHRRCGDRWRRRPAPSADRAAVRW